MMTQLNDIPEFDVGDKMYCRNGGIVHVVDTDCPNGRALVRSIGGPPDHWIDARELSHLPILPPWARVPMDVTVRETCFRLAEQLVLAIQRSPLVGEDQDRLLMLARDIAAVLSDCEGGG